MERSSHCSSTLREKVRKLTDVVLWIVLTCSAVAELSVRPDLIHKLVPPHHEETLRLRSIDINNFKPIPLEQLRITLD